MMGEGYEETRELRVIKSNIAEEGVDCYSGGGIADDGPKGSWWEIAKGCFHSRAQSFLESFSQW